jgi:hypothetical protein
MLKYRGKMPLPQTMSGKQQAKLPWLFTAVGVAFSHEMYALLLLLSAPCPRLNDGLFTFFIS